MDPVLRDLGMKRKDVYGSSCVPCVPCAPCKDDSENEIIYPMIEAYGAMAKALPLKDMKPGVEYMATVRLRLKNGNFDEKAGVTSGTVALVAISDLECCDEESDEPDDAMGKAVVRVMKKRADTGSSAGGAPGKSSSGMSGMSSGSAPSST